MKILIAEDDSASRCVLEANLVSWGFEVISTRNGREAFEALQSDLDICLAVLDYVMPEMDGVEVCRHIRQGFRNRPIHLLILTTRNSPSDLVRGLAAGADGFVTKPFDRDELHARILAGARIVNLQRELSEKVRELHEALERVWNLEGMLPMCSYCKKIRDDQNNWEQVDVYISRRSQATVSHAVCPSCYEQNPGAGIDAARTG